METTAQRSAMATVDVHQAAMLAWMQEIAPYGIFTTDTQLKIQSWNEWLETHSGLAAPLVVGRSLLEVFPELRTRKLEEHFHRALAGEVIVLSAAFHDYLLPFPVTIRDCSFPYMQQTARIAPLTSNNQSCGTIVVIEDVTQRVAQSSTLARQHERDQFLSSSLAHLLRTRDPEKMVHDLFPKVAEQLRADCFLNFLLEPDGVHMVLNAAAGIAESEKLKIARLAVGDSLSGLAVTERRPILINHLQDSVNPHANRPKALGFRAITCHPLMVGSRLIGTLAFGTRTRDSFSTDEVELAAAISQYAAIGLDRAMSEAALSQAQEDLRNHALNLEVRIQERTARLQDTIVQLESFSYTVAHDLRAPIRALKGYAQVLLEDSSPIPEESRVYLSRIERAANRLDALTRDLLQFSTISRQDVTLTSVDMSELVQDLKVLRPALQDDVLVVREPLHRVLGHRTLLQHCLSNLLDNALKFVTPGVKPRIVLWTELVTDTSHLRKTSGRAFNPAVYPETANPVSTSGSPDESRKTPRIRLWVEDNGIGIAPESREKVFGIFERLNSPDKYEGTGIGLAIVARAMQRMNGSCGVEPGEGSRFWLELMVP
jgi:signal transduction histidine kinase